MLFRESALDSFFCSQQRNKTGRCTLQVWWDTRRETMSAPAVTTKPKTMALPVPTFTRAIALRLVPFSQKWHLGSLSAY